MSVLDAALEGTLGTHEGPEPYVVLKDVQSILNSVIRPDDKDTGISVAEVADRARVSPRTVYRVLTPEEGKTAISLSLADKLCKACDAHVSECRLEWPDGTITGYHDLLSDKTL